MEEENTEKKYVLVTGASSGIGKEISIELAKQGYSLVIIGRDKKRLQDLKDILVKEHEVDIVAISADLVKKDIARTLNEGLKKKNIRIFGLVNNAGFGIYGMFDEKSVKDYDEMIELNINALTQITYEFMDDLKKTEGFIMNISSIAGLVPVPYMAVYGATKSYVTSFTEALAQEYPNLRIYSVHPGFVETGFQKRAGQEEWIKTKTLQSSQKVAEEAVAALDSSDIIVYTDRGMKIKMFFSRFLPRKKVYSIMEKSMRLETKKD